MVTLRDSSKLFVLKKFLKYGKVLKGRLEERVDIFSTSVACDLIENEKPDFSIFAFDRNR